MDTNRQESIESYIPWFAEEYSGPVHKNTRVNDYLSLTPQEIKTMLDRRVLNQEDACRKIAVMMYQHLQGHRFVGLLAGPTGAGKSFIAESLKEAFPDVVYLRDVSNVTADGWKGDKKVSTLFHGVHNPFAYNGKIYPLLFLDECDKLFTPKITSGGENASQTVQSEFLTVIQGSEIEIVERSSSHNSQDTSKIVDTSRMSFLFAGAFDKKATEIANKASGSSMGFGASRIKEQPYNRKLTMDDVYEAGCMRELCGRIQKIVCLSRLEEVDFRKMLDYTDRGPIYELETEFNIPIYISDSKKDELAHSAYIKGLGVRGIKNVLREYIDELTWNNCHAKELEIC